MHDLHPNLPPLPSRIKRLPVDARGFPVPWFVAWFHADGKPHESVATPIVPGDYPDFRIADARKMAVACNFRICWVCGGYLGRYMAFTIGPMCAINRTSGDPPSHRECAVFSAMACPFLSKPRVERRENQLPPGVVMHPMNLPRNPGVTMVWVTGTYQIRSTDPNPVFSIGDPEEVLFFSEGRPATRAEIMHSIDTGMPLLRGEAEKDGAEAVATLARMYEEAIQLVPA